MTWISGAALSAPTLRVVRDTAPALGRDPLADAHRRRLIGLAAALTFSLLAWAGLVLVVLALVR